MEGSMSIQFLVRDVQREKSREETKEGIDLPPRKGDFRRRKDNFHRRLGQGRNRIQSDKQSTTQQRRCNPQKEPHELNEPGSAVTRIHIGTRNRLPYRSDRIGHGCGSVSPRASHLEGLHDHTSEEEDHGQSKRRERRNNESVREASEFLQSFLFDICIRRLVIMHFAMIMENNVRRGERQHRRNNLFSIINIVYKKIDKLDEYAKGF